MGIEGIQIASTCFVKTSQFPNLVLTFQMIQQPDFYGALQYHCGVIKVASVNEV